MKKDRNSKQKKWVKKRHARVFAFLRVAMAPLLRLRYHYRAIPAPIESGPCIVLFNHQTTMDPFFVSKSFPFQIYFFASDDLFNLKVSPIIRYLAAPIPKSKSVADPKAVMAALRILRGALTVEKRVFRQNNIRAACTPCGRTLARIKVFFPPYMPPEKM